MAIIAVFDTNIFFSATGWRGNPFQCIERARAGRVEVVICPELIEELAEKLHARPDHRRGLAPRAVVRLGPPTVIKQQLQ